MYCRTNPIHPKANSKGLYPLHRVLMENKLGRYLSSNEVVHHSNEDKTDNSIENLELLSVKDHTKHHSKKVELESLICPSCGKCFQEKPHFVRLRRKRNKSNQVFCSRSCGASRSLNVSLAQPDRATDF